MNSGRSGMSKSNLPKPTSIVYLCLFVFGNQAKSNILFTVIDLDRLIIKHSTELDNRPYPNDWC